MSSIASSRVGWPLRSLCLSACLPIMSALDPKRPLRVSPTSMPASVRVNCRVIDLAAALGSVREQIAGVTLSDTLLAQLLPMMEQEFGPADSYGVFIRSDTNVEDLPGFTGAGLSETVPNVRGLNNQLGTVPRVWGSVLSPRAIAWRSNLLTNPADVFASVLLMKSVPADKSGVLVTTDLAGRGDGLTVSTAWGVGGAVAGEATETIVLLPNGDERLLSETKAPFRRFLAQTGGVNWMRANSGPVLCRAEKTALRQLADEVAATYAPATDPDGRVLPWDIEFGFVDGELTLFQIRPLIERGQRRADRALLEIAGPSAPATDVVRTRSIAFERGWDSATLSRVERRLSGYMRALAGSGLLLCLRLPCPSVCCSGWPRPSARIRSTARKIRASAD